mmetsp:Transcript_23345/g.88563  ORF Transcript_23345/g.88563 Transcript_23345/m.88563 type:complete len:236 (-) Transcript_23345:110-817(-)
MTAGCVRAECLRATRDCERFSRGQRPCAQAWPATQQPPRRPRPPPPRTLPHSKPDQHASHGGPAAGCQSPSSVRTRAEVCQPVRGHTRSLSLARPLRGGVGTGGVLMRCVVAAPPLERAGVAGRSWRPARGLTRSSGFQGLGRCGVPLGRHYAGKGGSKRCNAPCSQLRAHQQDAPRDNAALLMGQRCWTGAGLLAGSQGRRRGRSRARSCRARTVCSGKFSQWVKGVASQRPHC